MIRLQMQAAFVTLSHRFRVSLTIRVNIQIFLFLGVSDHPENLLYTGFWGNRFIDGTKINNKLT